MIRTLKGNKVLLIGDVHGRTKWQDLLKEGFDYDLVIFMGDYFDPYAADLRPGMYSNFEDIIALKEAYPEKFLLLIGNHDGHYMGMTNGSRYSIDTQTKYGKRLEGLYKAGLLQKAYMLEGLEKPLLVTHAGLSRAFYWLFLKKDDRFDYHTKPEQFPRIPEKDIPNLEKLINEAPIRLFNFNGPFWDYYGTWYGQGPLWIRPEGLYESWPAELKQVVGHTQMNFKPHWERAGEDPEALFMCDNGNFYTEIIDGKFIVKEYEKNSTTGVL